jgi:hypothetical protein
VTYKFHAEVSKISHIDKHCINKLSEELDVCHLYSDSRLKTGNDQILDWRAEGVGFVYGLFYNNANITDNIA